MSDHDSPDSPSELGHLEDGEISRVHRPKRALPTDVVRPTRAEVHLSHLRHNLGLLRKFAGATPIWSVLKADGYGHGAKAVARTFERAGVDGFCVALVEEGVELREAGIALPILVMGGYYGDAYRELVHHGLTPVLSDRGQVESLAQALQHSAAVSMKCHVKVDTGMARLGATAADWPEMIATLGRHRKIDVDGLMTHLANADMAEAGVLDEPLRQFAEARAALQRAGMRPGNVHMANSAALLRDRRTHFDLVRPGIALFGVDPLAPVPPKFRAEHPLSGRLRPAMSVLSRVVGLRALNAGHAVGYGGSFVASRPTIVATVPMGYADGLTRRLSGRAQVLIRGKRAPMVGNISMDMTNVDVTDVPGVTMLDEVVILGHQKGPLGEDSILPAEIAAWSDSIPWEVLTNISRRVPRFYRET